MVASAATGRAWALFKDDAATGARSPAAMVRGMAGARLRSARGVATAVVMAWLVFLLQCSTVWCSTLYGDPVARVNRSLADSYGCRTKIMPTFCGIRS